MQKAIIVGVGGNGQDHLNRLLSDGWHVVDTEQFRPSVGGDSSNYTLGTILVIVEKE